MAFVDGLPWFCRDRRRLSTQSQCFDRRMGQHGGRFAVMITFDFVGTVPLGQMQQWPLFTSEQSDSSSLVVPTLVGAGGMGALRLSHFPMVALCHLDGDESLGSGIVFCSVSSSWVERSSFLSSASSPRQLDHCMSMFSTQVGALVAMLLCGDQGWHQVGRLFSSTLFFLFRSSWSAASYLLMPSSRPFVFVCVGVATLGAQQVGATGAVPLPKGRPCLQGGGQCSPPLRVRGSGPLLDMAGVYELDDFHPDHWVRLRTGLDPLRCGPGHGFCHLYNIYAVTGVWLQYYLVRVSTGETRWTMSNVVGVEDDDVLDLHRAPVYDHWTQDFLAGARASYEWFALVVGSL